MVVISPESTYSLLILAAARSPARFLADKGAARIIGGIFRYLAPQSCFFLMSQIDVLDSGKIVWTRAIIDKTSENVDMYLSLKLKAR